MSVAYRLGDDVGDEAHHRGILVDVRLGVAQGLGRDVALVAVLQRARADAEVLDDQLVHPLGHRQVPDDRPRREGPEPVRHRLVGQPGRGEVERGRRRGLDLLVGRDAEADRDDLEIVHQPRRQEAAGARIGLEVQGHVQPGGGGGRREDRVLVAAQGGHEDGQPAAAGGLQHRLALLGGQPQREGLGQRFLEGRGHGFRAPPAQFSSFSRRVSFGSGIRLGSFRNSLIWALFDRPLIARRVSPVSSSGRTMCGRMKRRSSVRSRSRVR